MASSAMQDVAGQVAAGGDSLRQSPWDTLIYQGLRALVNLMPGAYQVNQNLNQMELQLNRRELLEFTASYLHNSQTSVHIKWSDLNACISMLGATHSPDLDRFIPDVAPKKNFVASDSVLTLFNGVPTRDWPTMWHENKHVWSKYTSESCWAVRDSATILEILVGMQTIVANNSER